MRVLFLTHRVPYAPNRGDRVRAYHIVKSLASSFDVEVVALAHDAAEAAEVQRLHELGVRSTAVRVPHVKNHLAAALQLLGERPLTHVLLDAPGVRAVLEQIVRDRPPDVVLAFCSGMARFALLPPLAGYPLVVDLVDVDSQKWSAFADASSGAMRWVYGREAVHLAAFERALAYEAKATLVVNEREREALRRIAPGAAIQVLSVGVDVESLARGAAAPDGRPTVVFCGVMNYKPNVDGVLWFGRNVWPIVRRQFPHARFLIVGSDPTRAIRRLASDDRSIEVTHAVDDVRPYLWRSAVTVAPLMTARGIQTKVLEALAAGLPAVVTTQVREGLPSCVAAACDVADSVDEFAAATIGLLDLPDAERRRIAASADIAQLNWEAQLKPLHRLLRDVAQRPAMAV